MHGSSGNNLREPQINNNTNNNNNNNSNNNNNHNNNNNNNNNNDNNNNNNNDNKNNENNLAAHCESRRYAPCYGLCYHKRVRLWQCFLMFPIASSGRDSVLRFT